MSTVSLSPDQLCAAGSKISREWGEDGYTIEAIESISRRVAAFRVRCSDGGRFFVLADRWGNTADLACNGVESESFESAELLHKAELLHNRTVG